MRKILSLVLALSMVLGMFSFAFAADLSDIEGEYYEAAVEALVELGVVNGYTDGTYKADRVVTRAELAKMLVVSLGQDSAAKIAKGSTQFTDVAADHWASGYINVAAQSKVIVGYPDGTFNPEATVSYAEAVTMALRALGYKNVVESAGTWPTNYITKANELQLLRDMKNVEADEGAKRGNVAILLWNMLRTEMWDIDSENQTNGMTYRKTEDPMLNIKFPDYEYEDEATFVSYDVDGTEVHAVVTTDAGNLEADLRSADLLRLVPGMKVAYLYNSHDEVFLTMTCVDTLVEGRVDENGKLNGKEYTGITAANKYKYVVALIDGKVCVNAVVLPDGGVEIDGDNVTLKKAQKTITEDVLVLIDGEFCTGEDLKEQDVYTEISSHPGNIGDTFYVVSRNRAKGTFESDTIEVDADGLRGYMEVDGENYDVYGKVTVYEYNEKNEEYDELTDAEVGKAFGKDGKFLDEDVELALDYLGNVVNMYFGETKDSEDSDFRFFVTTGNHIWFESSKGGMKYYWDMTDVEGDEDTQTLEASLGVHAFSSMESMRGGVNKYLTDIYEDAGKGEAGEAALVEAILDQLIVVFNVNDDDELEMPKAADLNAEYYIGWSIPVTPNTEILDKDNYLTDEDTGDKYKVTGSTKVIKVTPVLDDDEVVGLEVEALEGAEALDGVDLAKFVVEVEDGHPKARAKYVFVAEDAKSSELTFGVVEKYLQRKGIDYVEFDEGTYELDDKGITNLPIGAFASFRASDSDEATVREGLLPTDDIYAKIVTEVDDELIYVNDVVTYDTSAETCLETYEDTTFVVLNITTNKDDEVEFEDTESYGKGIDNATFKKGDRLVELTQDDVIVIIRGLKDTDVVAAGVVTNP